MEKLNFKGKPTHYPIKTLKLELNWRPNIMFESLMIYQFAYRSYKDPFHSHHNANIKLCLLVNEKFDKYFYDNSVNCSHSSNDSLKLF